MDVVQDWASYLFWKSGPLLTYFNPYASQLTYLTAIAKSWLFPVVNQVIEKPDLATIALLLVILFISLKILGVLWNSIKFWIGMAWNMIFYGGLVAIGLWFWTRGPDGVMDDVQYWAGHWNNEHKFWIDKERAAKAARQRSAQGKFW